MKNWIFIFLILLSFQSCYTMSGTLYIPKDLSLIWGEGKHGSYKATVQNIGQDDLDVFLVNERGVERNIGLLNIGDTQVYEVPANCSLIFRNIGTEDYGAATYFIKGSLDLKRRVE